MKANALSELDVLDVCQVMLQRCGLSVIQLAKHMGEPLVAPAPAPVVTQAAATEHDPIPPRMAQALGFAARTGGVTIAELQQLMTISMQTAFTYVHGLNKRGRLTRVKVPGNRGSRYFADGAAALAWVKRPAPEPQDAAAPAPPPPHDGRAPLQPQPDGRATRCGPQVPRSLRRRQAGRHAGRHPLLRCTRRTTDGRFQHQQARHQPNDR